MSKTLLLFFFLFTASGLSAQQLLFTGNITDSQGNPIAFASVYIKGTTQGNSANEKGVYQLRLKPGKYDVNYRAIGFKQQTVPVEITDKINIQNIKLIYEDYQLIQPVAGGEDPAFNMIRNAIKKRVYYLNEIEAYSCNVYIKGVQKLISAPKGMLSAGVAKELQLDSNKKGILYLSESESKFNYQQPNRVKEIMISSKVAGNNNAFNFNRAADLQINFYKNMFDIEGLNPRGFISPIASNALSYYTYKLLGTATENGKVIDKIQVIPIRDHDPVFRGNIYIIEGDWRIYNAHLYLTKQASLNLVDTLNINQQYIPVKDDIWQPASVAFNFSGNVLGFKYNGYVIGNYSNYNLDPKFPKHFFNGEIIRIEKGTTTRDSLYWSANRPIPLTKEERSHYDFKDSILKKHELTKYIDSIERETREFEPISYTFFGDTITNRRNKTTLIFKPLYETLFFNTVEGFGVDMKVAYHKQLNSNKSYSITPEVRYGFSNQLLNANVELNYTSNAATRTVFYSNLGSSAFDLNSEASVSQFVNTISTLFFKDNILKLYQSKYARFGLQTEVARGLFLDGYLEYAKRNALVNTTFFRIRDVNGKDFTANDPLHLVAETKPTEDVAQFNENNAVTLKLSATYTFDEEYVTRPEGRFFEPDKYPKIKINYRKGVKNVLSSDVDYDYADLQVFQDNIKLGLLGHSSFLVGTGKFFNSNALIYPDFKQFKGNVGITFTPTIGSFHFLPYYTYSRDSFLEAHAEHNFSGFLFNKIPGVRKLKLDEIVGVNYLTQPGNNSYSEYYIGIQRFFFRLDYGVAYMGGKQVNQGILIYYGF